MNRRAVVRRLRWWLVAGAATPLAAYFHSLLRGGGDQVTVLLWPASFLLMGVPEELGLLTLLIVAAAWMSNAVLYLVLGLIAVAIEALIERLR